MSCLAWHSVVGSNADTPMNSSFRSLKFKGRSLHAGGKSGKPHLPVRVGSGFKIEPPHSNKAILDMNLDRRCVNGFAVSALDSEFDGAGTCTTLNNRSEEHTSELQS